MTTTTRPTPAALAAADEIMDNIHDWAHRRMIAAGNGTTPTLCAELAAIIDRHQAAESARLRDLIRRADDLIRSGEMEYAAARRRLAEALDLAATE